MNERGAPIADVVNAIVEVAAESGRSGTFTGDVGHALASVADKVTERIVREAEFNGFVSGWQEAVSASYGPHAGAQVYRMPRQSTNRQNSKDRSARTDT
ncbi:hypothetical protein ACFU99_42260 [Streptomyces sp. NPDC057654]|uniref:hypothetical protein n=1 Tax=Streptomyces sp. NPDC057654 TaxID=3346196 RepID=UPI0036C7D14A